MNARSSEAMNWIPGTILRLNRSSLVMKRSHFALAAHASWIASGGFNVLSWRSWA
jgi:hypothetical protein